MFIVFSFSLIFISICQENENIIQKKKSSTLAENGQTSTMQKTVKRFKKSEWSDIMLKRRTTEDFVDRARKIHGDKYDYSKSEYSGSKKKVTIICKEHGEFEQTPNTHLSNHGCAKCWKSRRTKTTEYFVTKARKVHGDKYDYSKVDYIHSEKKVIILCSSHGEFLQTASEHLQGSGCIVCRNEKNTKPVAVFLSEANNIHKNKYDYHKMKYSNSTEKIIIVCKIHGEFNQTPTEHIQGYGCPKCGGSFPLTTEEFIEKAKKVHGDKYDYSKTVYTRTKNKVTIICKKHGEFQQTANAHVSAKKGCEKCTVGISNKEIQLLNELKIPIEHRQKYIKPYYVDGEIDNTIYEFLGDFWHGNPALYKRKDINEVTNTTFGQLYDKTIIRFDALVNLGYSIKYIWENEWDKWLTDKTNPLPLKEYKSLISL